MSLNSVDSKNIIQMISRISERANNLQAMIQGAPISSVKIGTAIITTAKIADLSITTAKIDDGAVTNAKIANLSATKVNAGSISADRIGAGSITASKLNVASLSAISADFGTITSGSIAGITITGNIIRTSSGGERIEIYDNLLRFYNSGNERVRITNTYIAVFNIGIFFQEFGGGSSRGIYGISGGNAVLGSSNVPLIILQSLNGRVIVTGTNDILFSCNDFQINGSSKSAIVPTENHGYRALYCVESPEVWFFDVLDAGDDIDPMFMEVTDGEIKSITNDKGQKIIFRRRAGFANIRFEEKTHDEFVRNNNRWNNQ